MAPSVGRVSAQIADDPRTVVLYEAPHRVVRTIADLIEVCGPDRPVAVARELTKLYETVVRGTLGNVEIGEPRGEYVIVLGGAPVVETHVGDDEIAAAVDAELAGGASTRDAAARAASALGVPRRTGLRHRCQAMMPTDSGATFRSSMSGLRYENAGQPQRASATTLM